MKKRMGSSPSSPWKLNVIYRVGCKMKSGFCDRWLRPWVLCSAGSNLFFLNILVDIPNLVWPTRERRLRERGGTRKREKSSLEYLVKFETG
ncbi:hypothetical protein FJTKL_04915 [Diaporthe vaccinii]|uniref:Uncharacterized protein n=1 Tax=Diaporthe vaccinii TaxID=105482 RepID=A0ABR4DSS9_9PEZI